MPRAAEQQWPADERVAALDRAAHAQPVQCAELRHGRNAAAEKRRRTRAMARAIGCAEAVSSAPATASTSPTSSPAAGTTATTDISPVVTVPVLSSTTVSTSRVDSSTSGPLIRMPSWAPRPVPTSSAVGVASPSAQGQATTSTAVAARNAGPTSVPTPEPEAERRGGQQQHGRDEDAADTRSARRCTAALPLCACSTSAAIWARRVSAPTRVAAHDEPAADVDAAADDGVALGDLGRHRLAGEHARVDRRGALDDDAVGRDLLAGPDDEPVADHDLLDRHAHLAAVPRTTDASVAASPSSASQRGPGAPAGACLGVAAGEHERGDPGGDLEVEVRARHPSRTG